MDVDLPDDDDDDELGPDSSLSLNPDQESAPINPEQLQNQNQNAASSASASAKAKDDDGLGSDNNDDDDDDQEPERELWNNSKFVSTKFVCAGGGFTNPRQLLQTRDHRLCDESALVLNMDPGRMKEMLASAQQLGPRKAEIIDSDHLKSSLVWRSNRNGDLTFNFQVTIPKFG